jgi:hypothetical protein
MALTDEQIIDLRKSTRPANYSAWGETVAFARAIESAACAERDARIAELERQLAEARKDAERYQCAVSVCESDGFGYWIPEVCLKEGPLPPSKEEADAAIDNAMQKG